MQLEEHQNETETIPNATKQESEANLSKEAKPQITKKDDKDQTQKTKDEK